MFGNSGALNGYPFEGAFVSAPVDRSLAPTFYNPVPSVLASPGALRAAPGGTLQGRFGWAGADGLVRNTRLAPGDTIGIVKPFRSSSGADVVGYGWTWQTWDSVARAFRVRQGLGVNLIASGPFWVRFAGGAYTGEPVYASLLDGSAVSGPAAGCELTPWVVSSNGPPGNLAIISTSAFFGA